MSKYKYYFRKPKSEIVKDILSGLLMAGVICIASTSPYFVLNLQKGIRQWLKQRKYQKREIYSAFHRLKKEGCIDIEIKNHQIYISLTEKGKKKAGWMQINDLKIKKPKKWDSKWRLVIFDISQIKKIYREAFRGRLKELGFYPLQKSVWVYPFDCQDEVELLKDFFGLSDDELRLIIAEEIGQNKILKKFFNIV